MAERAAAVGPLAGAWGPPGFGSDLALQYLRSRRPDPCADRVAIELARRRTPAELGEISRLQAETLADVIYAVLGRIELTPEQHTTALEIAVAELRRASGEDSR